MIIIEADKEEYARHRASGLCFSSVFFNDINSKKTDEVKYLLFKDNKYRFALPLGIQEKKARCPFSAPFGFLEPIKSTTSVECYDDAIKSLDLFLIDLGIVSMEFTLPPSFYDDGINLMANSLFRNSYTIKKIDLNYSYDLEKFNAESFNNLLPRNGRKNLNIALNSCLTLQTIKHSELSPETIASAYSIIAMNRESKGYPLRMTLQDLQNTSRGITCDVFIVLFNEIAIASAVVYHTTDVVAQVIYWGDANSYSSLKPINFLSYNLVNHYKRLGFKYLDIGPSSENSIPNYGLCDFKTSIGCSTSLKICMTKSYPVNKEDFFYHEKY